MLEKLRIFKLLLYKNYLVRKGKWKTGLFVEIILTVLIFLSIWIVRGYTSGPSMNNRFIPNTSYSEESVHIPNKMKKLFVVPDTKYVSNFMKEVQTCYKMKTLKSIINSYKTEEEMLEAFGWEFINNTNTDYENTLAVVFKNDSFDSYTTHFEYKIITTKTLPPLFKSMNFMSDETLKIIVGFQTCLDTIFIHRKKRNDKINAKILIQRMPTIAHSESDISDNVLRIVLCVFALLAFLIPLCIEASYASEEKFLGVNVLMSMNGVPNYLNLLSWLISGVIFSLFYTIPIIILLTCSEPNTLPFIYFGNFFIVWVLLTLNIAHLIAFGIHVSAYFRKPLFFVTGLLVLYVGSTALERYGITESNHPIVPFLGIIFPNILLFRGFEEINYFETTTEGIHWSNLFKISKPSYGNQGSLGATLIFSMLGIIFNFLMAVYIYAINPGKYGIKKHPFYFLNIFKRSRNTTNYNAIENLEINNDENISLETVIAGTYTPGIQIRNLKKTYNLGLFNNSKVHAVKGISVDFYHGQITALLGHNGAGKTTMMSILTGMISPTEGLVLVHGKNIKEKSDEIMRDMGLCPQENMVFPNLSVGQQLTFFAMLKNKNKTRSDVETNVTKFLQKLNLFEKRHTLPKKLSGGQKRRVCLGMAMVGDSSVLVLDEPTSGLDPESRRSIWDILLEIRKNKTVIISTHDMEEADIVGDRIAIIHGGKLRSYGTAMYLKKLIGKGNVELTLSTEPNFNPENVLNYLDPQSEIVNTDGSKTVLSIPNSSELPDSLDKIESNKKELGVTGMSVSLITLEQVFLKVARDNDDESDLRKPFIDNVKKLSDKEQSLHSAKGLLYKKLIYTKKNITIIITMLLLVFIAMACITLLLMDHDTENTSSDPVPLRLDIYNIPETYYETDNKSKIYGKNYKALTEEYSATAINDAAGLETVAARDAATYNYRLLAGAKFRMTRKGLLATALYNKEEALFTLPVAMNLLTNTLLKTTSGSKYKIDASVQQFTKQEEFSKTHYLFIMWIVEAYLVPFILICLLYPAVALFVVHPARENLTNIKHLQRMTGVSGFNYWGTMFLFDFFVLIGLFLLITFGFIIIDVVLELRIFHAIDLVILMSLFILFTINILPFMYCFSFWEKTTNTTIKLLSILPLILVTVEIVMNVIAISIGYSEDSTSVYLQVIRPFQKIIFLGMPYISFFHGQVAFFRTAKLNANCERVSLLLNDTCNDFFRLNNNCCDMKCSNGVCEKPEKYFDNLKEDHLKEDISLHISIISLGVTSILYFGILYLLEYKLIAKLSVKLTSIPKENIEPFDEAVKRETSDIASQISKIRGNYNKKAQSETEETLDTDGNTNGITNNVLTIYQLKKMYKSLVAVRELSFSVQEKQCFGLLGVNGAGKSTSFRMMTGEEIPNYGEMYLGNNDLMKNEQFLSEIGYCPQNDAIIKSLNAYDHLTLFARLRGIPEDQVDAEVKKWIDRLNLNACAMQPSGTYSGGNKRRLNIAMALMGLPKLVLMDEPTTGVDPAARRSLWNIIQSCQKTGQAIVLTSHSMEECEALCNKLGIMVDGRLVCLGAAEELKQRFGAGYNIQIKLNPEKYKDQIKSIKTEIDIALDCEKMDDNSGYLMYHVTSMDVTWRQMYDVMTNLKNKYDGIEDFSVLTSTLEQLFLLFARAADKKNKREL